MTALVRHADTPRPGDLAHHRDGLDTRRIARVEGDNLWLEVLGGEYGPYSTANYTFTRILPERRWSHARKGIVTGVVVEQGPVWLTVELTQPADGHEPGDRVTFRRSFATEL